MALRDLDRRYMNYSNGRLSFSFRRSLASAVEADWRNRMVFFEGDERASFYQGLDGK